MKFKTLSDYYNKNDTEYPYSVVNKDGTRKDDGTHLVDSVVTTYEVLECLFGHPNDSMEPDKVSSQWILQSEEGHILTAYKWKNTPRIYNIGAHGFNASVSALIEYLEEATAKLSINRCYSCRLPFAALDWHTPTSCPHCHATRVD